MEKLYFFCLSLSYKGLGLLPFYKFDLRDSFESLHSLFASLELPRLHLFAALNNLNFWCLDS